VHYDCGHIQRKVRERECVEKRHKLDRVYMVWFEYECVATYTALMLLFKHSSVGVACTEPDLGSYFS
jgi:hypothetical protein